jgi:hypothetical protein
MKKYILTLGLAAITSLGFVSCEDSLDNQPFNSQDPSGVFANPAGFDNAMRGVYSGLVGIDNEMYGTYLGGGSNIWGDLLGDNLIISQTGRLTNKANYEWIYSANSTPFLYADAYKVIFRANAILNNIDNLSDGEFKDNIKGEALAIRALAQFDAMKMYAKIPTQSADANTSMGIAILTTADAFVSPARNTVAENYSSIIADLEMAKDLISADNGVGRFNKNTVNGILSRAHLYNGNMSACITAANAVTANVTTLADFPGIWKDVTNPNEGVLSRIVLTQDRGVDIGTEYSQTSPDAGIKSEYVATFDLFNLYQSTDVRKDAYFKTEIFAGNMYNHIAKHFGKTGQTNNYVDHKVIRMAEVMLNKAEAYAHSSVGDDASALAALDAVRSQRYTGFVSGGETGVALKTAIALERRLELAFEGHRFYDLKRTGQDVVRSATNGDFADGSGTPAVNALLSAGDYRFQLPIPQDAINANTNTQQNPGY